MLVIKASFAAAILSSLLFFEADCDLPVVPEFQLKQTEISIDKIATPLNGRYWEEKTQQTLHGKLFLSTKEGKMHISNLGDNVTYQLHAMSPTSNDVLSTGEITIREFEEHICDRSDVRLYVYNPYKMF